MIKAMTVTNSKNESLRLELANPDPEGMYIEDVSGIGLADADILVEEIASGDGGYYSFSRSDPREISIKLGFLEYPSIEEVRQRCYKYFNIKKKVELAFETEERLLMITGYVQKNDPDIFSSEETTDIEILCPDPWFYDSGTTIFGFEGTDSGFEFPFSNESLSKNLLEFGELRLDTRCNIEYQGDIDTGFIMDIGFLGPVAGLTIFNTVTREEMSINEEMISRIIGVPMDQDVELRISTVSGDKYAVATYKGKDHSIVGALGRNSDWFQLSAGDNLFAFSCKEGQERVRMRFTYTNKYGGV